MNGRLEAEQMAAQHEAANTWLQEEIKRLRLTDAEREAIEAAIRSWPAIGVSRENVDSLRGLLERLSPPTT
jgi:hypothetical protein